MGALVLVALVGYMVWAALQPDVEPSILVEINRGQIVPRASAWVVPIQVINQSTRSLSDVQVSVALVDEAGNVVAEESVTISLLGQRESAAAEIWFDCSPEDFDLRADIGSYKFP